MWMGEKVCYQGNICSLHKTSCYIKLPDHIVLENKDLITQAVGGVIPKVVIFRMYPGKEKYAYANSLLRQFILKKDAISIYKICKNIKELGTNEQFKTCRQIGDDFTNYIQGPSNLLGRTIEEYMDNINYSDIYHRNIPKEVRDYYACTHFAEYFLNYLSFIYKIGLIVEVPEFDDNILIDHNPEDILNRPKRVR